MRIIKNILEYFYDNDLLPFTRKNYANYITLIGSWISRISLYLFFIFFVWFLMYDAVTVELRYVAIGLSIVASVFDALDGYYARKNNCVTKLGQIFDPHHDKVQYICKTISLLMDSMVFYLITGEIIYPIFSVILCYISSERDETVGFHRQWATLVSSAIELSARPSGKWRTRVCFSGMPLLHLLIEPMEAPQLFMGISLLLAGVTIWSLYDYVGGYRKAIKKFLNKQ